ncbi:stalk domain-containing protein [Paenibacillus sp. GCM10027627]|uniref:stalk domain-containing protein n=1 Tax=unclassified Paenibacillus TaxID=185978 RepID=UPI00362C80A2
MYSNLRKTLGRAAAAAVIAGCLLQATSVSLVKAEAPAAGASSSYDIVVLGDSIAAGYEHGFTEKSVPYGFGEHVYEQALFQGYRAEYSNFGILGLKSEGLSKWLLAAEAGKTVTKSDIQASLADPRAESFFKATDKLGSEMREAELVLVSIGGNDFLQLLAKMNANTDFAASPKAAQDELSVFFSDLIANYAKQLDSTFAAIQKLQPKAEVVIANQYLPVPFLTVNGQITYLIPNSTAQFLVNGQKNLLAQLQDVVSKYAKQGLDVKIADAASAIEKSILSYTSINATDSEGKPDPDSHPTRAGYAQLGAAYTEPLWGAYKKVQERKPNVPISVVVGGKEIVTKYAPTIRKGRTFISIADITDAIGAKRTWNAKTQTASIQLDGRTVDITIGAKTIRIDGKTVPLNADPAFLNQFPGEKKTYIPLAALSEGLGLQVVYRDTLKTAFINR